MPGEEIVKKVDPFDEHSMAHKWEHGSGTEAGGGDGSKQEGAYASYFAGCTDCPHGGWKGPFHPTREAAQADADAHNESHPGHGATVVAF